MTIFGSLSRIFYTNCPIRQKGKRYMRCALFLSLSLFKRPPLNDAPLFYAIRSSSRASSVRNFQQYQAPESSSAETRRLFLRRRKERNASILPPQHDIKNRNLHTYKYAFSKRSRRQRADARFARTAGDVSYYEYEHHEYTARTFTTERRRGGAFP